MKNIKNILNLLVIILVASLCFTACEDKLKEQDGQLGTGDLDYTKTSDMVLPLIGAYGQIYSRGWEDPLLLGVRGDDVNAGGLGDQQPFADTDMFNYDRNYWMYNSLWTNMYSDILDINNARETIQTYKDFAPESAYAKADQFMAETKVLSGWTHLQMARVWGSVFIITKSDVTDDLANGVASKSETMQYVSDLMDEAIPNLPDMRPNQRTDVPGGVTKYTALAVKALANLELENYQEVANATGQIINSDKFMLFNDFYELFKNPGELSNENLFEFQFSDYGSATGAVNYHLYEPFGPENWTPARAGASSGWGFYEPSFKYIKFMLDRNETVRLQTSVLFTNRGIAEIKTDPAYATLPSWISNTTPDGDVINDFNRAKFSSGKHYLPSTQLTEGRNIYGSGKNFIVIRYAEILLMYAEALTHGANGNGMTADQAVNLVRNRAGLGNLTGVTHADVMDEKFAELAMEWGIRYYDLIRLKNYDELSYDGRVFSPDKALLPYPQDQVDLLPLGVN